MFRARNLERGGFHALDRADQQLAFGRQPHAVDMAREQGVAGLALELLDVTAQGIDRELQSLRRRAKTAAPHDFQKGARAFPVAQAGIGLIFHLFYGMNVPRPKFLQTARLRPSSFPSLGLFTQATGRTRHDDQALESQENAPRTTTSWKAAAVSSADARPARLPAPHVERGRDTWRPTG